METRETVNEELRRTLHWLVPFSALVYIGFGLFDWAVGSPLVASLQIRFGFACLMMVGWFLAKRLSGEWMVALVFGVLGAFSLGQLCLAQVQHTPLTPVLNGIIVPPLVSSFVHLKRRTGLLLYCGGQFLAVLVPIAQVYSGLPAKLQPMALSGAFIAVVVAILGAQNGANLLALREAWAGSREKLERARADVERALERDRARLDEVTGLMRGLGASVQVLRDSVQSLRREGDALAGSAAQMRAGLEAAAVDGQAVRDAATSIDDRAQSSRRSLEDLGLKDREEGAASRTRLREDARAMSVAASEIARISEAVAQVARQTRMLALNASVEAPRLGRGEVDVLAERMRQFSADARSRSGRIEELARKLLTVARRLELDARSYAEAQDRAGAIPRDALSHLAAVSDRSGEIRQRSEQMAEATSRQGQSAADFAGAGTRLLESVRTLEHATEELQGVAGGLESWLPSRAGGSR